MAEDVPIKWHSLRNVLTFKTKTRKFKKTKKHLMHPEKRLGQNWLNNLLRRSEIICIALSGPESGPNENKSWRQFKLSFLSALKLCVLSLTLEEFESAHIFVVLNPSKFKLSLSFGLRPSGAQDDSQGLQMTLVRSRWLSYALGNSRSLSATLLRSDEFESDQIFKAKFLGRDGRNASSLTLALA